jgi:hypothetical protein
MLICHGLNLKTTNIQSMHNKEEIRRPYFVGCFTILAHSHLHYEVELNGIMLDSSIVIISIRNLYS